MILAVKIIGRGQNLFSRVSHHVPDGPVRLIHAVYFGIRTKTYSRYQFYILHLGTEEISMDYIQKSEGRIFGTSNIFRHATSLIEFLAQNILQIISFHILFRSASQVLRAQFPEDISQLNSNGVTSVTQVSSTKDCARIILKQVT